MNELSIFIDESGDFGEYDYRSPYYIIAMVFHKQEHSIHEAVDKLNHELSYMGLNNLCIRTDEGYREKLVNDETACTGQAVFIK